MGARPRARERNSAATRSATSSPPGARIVERIDWVPALDKHLALVGFMGAGRRRSARVRADRAA